MTKISFIPDESPTMGISEYYPFIVGDGREIVVCGIKKGKLMITTKDDVEAQIKNYEEHMDMDKETIMHDPTPKETPMKKKVMNNQPDVSDLEASAIWHIETGLELLAEDGCSLEKANGILFDCIEDYE